MNKTSKILIISLLVLVLLAGVALGVAYFGFGIDIFDRSGWFVTEDGHTQYLDYHGEPLSGWQEIDGKWYYFNPSDTYMHTGWLEMDVDRYYLGENGVQVTGWLETADGIYYLSPVNGAAAVGWLELDGLRYYFDDAARMVTGWADVEGKRYYLNEYGNMVTGWLELDGNRYYLAEDGAMQTGWLETAEGTLYLDETSGAMTTGWLELEEGRYYLDESGYRTTGWTDTADGRFYMDENGLVTTGWLEIDGKTYYLGDTGLMTVGWLELEDKRYYFLEDGAMAIGKVIIDDLANYFTSTGAQVILVNKWNEVPEDYTVDLVNFGSWQVDSSCLEALTKMLEDCPYGYSITSAYRTISKQQSIWNSRMAGYKASGYTDAQALQAVSQSVAVPGTSEHHLGLAIDISGKSTQAWLAEHCWEYGFILRYPEGKTAVTGIIHEPWHYRYVGTELALELKELGLTMEEYMDMLTEQAGSDAGSASAE